MREVVLGATFTFGFTTRINGVPTSLLGTPVLSVKEGANDTPITSGVSVDVDTCATPVTGLNEGTVVATSGNGYEAGKSYFCYISTGTVGGVSVVGEIVQEFVIIAAAHSTLVATDIVSSGAITTSGGAVSTVTTVTDLTTTTRAEPGQGAPSATLSPATKLDYLFKAWRNKSTQTATTFSLYDDAGTTVDQKSTVSDDATTATRGEIATGP